MLLCVTWVVRGLLFLIQFRPKFDPIPDQLLFYRLCLTPVALPSVAGAVVARSVLNIIINVLFCNMSTHENAQEAERIAREIESERMYTEVGTSCCRGGTSRNGYYLRECAAEQRTSSWLRARVAKGLRAAPLRQFRRAKQRKLSQSIASYPSSRIKPTHHMLCRNFACWLPKIGLLLWIFWAPRT